MENVTTTDDDWWTLGASTITFKGTDEETITVLVPTVDDNIMEADQAVQLLAGAIFGERDGIAASLQLFAPIQGTIEDNDVATLHVNQVVHLEGDAGASYAQVDVLLIGQAESPFTVHAEALSNVSDNTPPSGNWASLGTDFSSTSADLTFSGDSGQVLSFTIPVLGDANDEEHEDVLIQLSALGGPQFISRLDLRSGFLTIANDDAPAIIVSSRYALDSVADANDTSSTILVEFTVTLVHPNTGPFAATISTLSGSDSQSGVIGGQDVVHTEEVLSFAGVHGETKTFTVDVLVDDIVEADDSVEIGFATGQAALQAFDVLNGNLTIWNSDRPRIRITPENDERGDDQVNFVVEMQNASAIPIVISAVGYANDPELPLEQQVVSAEFTFAGAAGQSETFSVGVRDDNEYQSLNNTFVEVAPSGNGGPTALEVPRRTPTRPGALLPTTPLPPASDEDCYSWLPYGGAWDDAITDPEVAAALWGTISSQLQNGVPWIMMNTNAGALEAWEQGLAIATGNQSASLDEGNIWGVSSTSESAFDAMRRLFKPFECKPVDDLAPIQPKLPEDDPTDDDLVTSYEKQVVATDWSISLNESITFDPFPEVFYSRGDKFAVGVSTIFSPDQTVTANKTWMYNELLAPDQQERLYLAHGFVVVNADNTITYTPHENLQYSWRPDFYTTLKPEYDRDENIVRFSGIDTFQAHLFPIVDRYGTEVAADKRDSIVATQSTSMQLAVSNNLPVMMGDYMHLPDGRTYYQIPDSDPPETLPANYMLLDGPISLPKQTRVEFNLDDLIYDADGNQSYRVLGAHVDGNWKGVDGVPLDYQFTGTEFVSLGVRSSASAAGQRVPLVVTAESDGTIALTNMVAPTDISADWNTEGQSGSIAIDIFFTDGQKYNFRNWPVGSPEGYIGDEVVYSARIIVIPDVYETDAQWKGNNGITTPDPREWITYASIDDNSFTPAVPKIGSVPASPGTSPLWRIHSEEVTGTLDQRVFEEIGGTYIDVINGTYTVPHSLILDGSGGNSAIPLGGLIYDSGTVFVDTTEVTVPPAGQLTPEELQEHLRKYTTLPAIHFLLDGIPNLLEKYKSAPDVEHAECYVLDDDSRPESLVAKLQWDPEGSESPATEIKIDIPADFCWKEQDNFFTVRPDIIADRSGVHFWNLEVDILFPEAKNIPPVTVRKSGEASIIRGDIDGMFGQGWWLQGFPSLFLDQRRSSEANDDRFMLFFPGSEPELFDATIHSKFIDSWEGELPNISVGSVALQSTYATGYAADLPGGLRDFDQHGSLVVDQITEGDTLTTEVTYRTGNGDDYVFRRTEMKDSNANPYYVYLLNRIRPSAVPFDPADWTNQNRGATVTWREDLPDGTPPRIHEISLPDGSTTKFDLNANHFVHEIITTIPGADPRKVRLEIVSEDTTSPPILKSITNLDQFRPPTDSTDTTPNPDAVHRFEYSNPSYPNFANKHGLLINEKWIEEEGDTQWIRNFGFYSETRSDLDDHPILRAVTLGELSDTENQITKWLQSTGDSIVRSGTTTLSVDIYSVVNDLEAYDGILDGAPKPLSSAGRLGEVINFDNQARRTRQWNYFENAGVGKVGLSEVAWVLDAVGNVWEEKQYLDFRGTVPTHDSDREIRKTRYWYDYNAPIRNEEWFLESGFEGNQQIDDSRDISRYESPLDYQQNVTFVFDMSGLDAFRYYTTSDVSDQAGDYNPTGYRQSSKGKLALSIENANLRVLAKSHPKPKSTGRITLFTYSEHGELTRTDTPSEFGVYLAPSGRNVLAGTSGDIDPEDFGIKLDPKRTDKLGRVELWNYDGGRLKMHVSPSGLQTTYQYNSKGLVDTVTTWDQVSSERYKVSYIYDPTGFLAEKKTEVIQPVTMLLGRELYVWNNQGDLLSHTVREGNTEQDEDGNVVSKIEYSYRRDGRVKETTNGEGTIDSTEYYSSGLVKTTIAAEGATYSNHHLNGVDVEIEDKTNYYYYADGTLRRTENTTSGDKNWWYYSYVTESGIAPTTWTVADGVAAELVDYAPTYTNLAVQKTTLDAISRIVATEDLLYGRTTNYYYDDSRLDLATRVEKVDIATESTISDGNLSGVNTLTIWDIYNYNSRGLVLQSRNAIHVPQAFYYDYLGNLRVSKIKSQLGSEQVFNWSPGGALISKTEVRRWDPAFNAVRGDLGSTDQSKDSASSYFWAYIDEPEPGARKEFFWTYKNDATGRVIEEIDPEVEKERDYIESLRRQGGDDPNKFLPPEVEAHPVTVSRIFENGRILTTTHLRNGGTQTEATDVYGRTHAIVNPYGGVDSYTFDVVGNVKDHISSGSGVPTKVISNSYDALGRIRLTTEREQGNGTNVRATYTDYFTQTSPSGPEKYDVTTTTSGGAFKGIATDSVGNPVLIADSNIEIHAIGLQRPATVIGYQFDESFGTLTLEKVSSYLVGGGVASDYQEVRANRSVISSSGNELLSTAYRILGATGLKASSTETEFDAAGRPKRVASGSSTTTYYYDDYRKNIPHIGSNLATGTGLVYNSTQGGSSGSSSTLHAYDSSGNLLFTKPQGGSKSAQMFYSYDGLRRITVERIEADYVVDSLLVPGGEGNNPKMPESAFRKEWVYIGGLTEETNRNGDLKKSLSDVPGRKRLEMATARDGGAIESTVEFYPNGLSARAETKVIVSGNTAYQSSIDYSYDVFGDVKQESIKTQLASADEQTASLNYEYDTNGVLKKTSRFVNGAVVSVTDVNSNAMGLATQVIQTSYGANVFWDGYATPQQKMLQLEYTAAGELKQQANYANALTTSSNSRGITKYAYEAGGTLIGIDHGTPSSLSGIAAFWQTFNGKGNILTNSERRGPFGDAISYLTTTYSYDPSKDLLLSYRSVDAVTGDDSGDVSLRIGGDQERFWDASVTRTNDGRITEVSETFSFIFGSSTYKYNAEGALVEIVDEEMTSETTTKLEWDALGRFAGQQKKWATGWLSGVTGLGIAKTGYDVYYDPLSRLSVVDMNINTQSPSSKQAVMTIYDQNGPALEINARTGEILKQYFVNPTSSAIVAVDVSQAGNGTETAWYFEDMAGGTAVIAVIEGLEWSTIHRRFSVDGVPSILSEDAGDFEWVFDSSTIYWQGKRADDFSRFYFAGTTVLDPQMGRTLSQVSGMSGGYSYANADPLNNTRRQSTSEAVSPISYAALTDPTTMARLTAAAQVFGGLVEVVSGAAACATGVGCMLGAVGIAHGLDSIVAGIGTYATDQVQESTFVSGIKSVATQFTSEETAGTIADIADLGVGILSGGLASAGRALGAKATMKVAMGHMAKQVLVETAGTVAGGYAGYLAMGEDGIMIGAMFGQAGASIVGAKYVKCFVDDTPVWVPLDGDLHAIVAAAGLGLDRNPASVPLGWRWYAGVGVATAAAVAYGARVKRRLEEELEDPLARLDKTLASVLDWLPEFELEEPESWNDEPPRLASFRP